MSELQGLRIEVRGWWPGHPTDSSSLSSPSSIMDWLYNASLLQWHLNQFLNSLLTFFIALKLHFLQFNVVIFSCENWNYNFMADGQIFLHSTACTQPTSSRGSSSGILIGPYYLSVPIQKIILENLIKYHILLREIAQWAKSLLSHCRHRHGCHHGTQNVLKEIKTSLPRGESS